ncbi:cytochrome c [Jannaschia sp. S6380]|uniref:cytochrome c n=1 Tax=Jannaschia sp. S6380 TaxID=2926408 RepID=UPI001FF5851D|nr:cytochrome c [Jannaschia sp. S6380]MCK0166199.1 cytochrome c [Jannaschia sp. S6380]
MRTKISLLALAGSMAAAAALAHTGATGVVLERMQAMSEMAKGVKAVTPMMRGTAPYDAGAVRDFASMVEGHSGETMVALFEEGTGGMPSQAKAEVWTDAEGFAALAEEMALRARGLALAAENAPGGAAAGGGASMMGGGGMMGGTGGMMGGTGGMMGGGSMMGGAGGAMTPEAIGAMPADRAFAMVSQTCSACHTRFRAEDD